MTLRILLAAYVIRPGAGSEDGNGWTWAEALSRHHDVTVLAQPHMRQHVEPVRRRIGRDRLTVEYLGDWVHDRSALGYWKAYRDWQDNALHAATDLHAQQPFDVAQHVTWGTVRVASRLHELDIPFVFGPVGGGEDVPLPFTTPAWVGAKETVKEVQRRAQTALARRSPSLHAMARSAAVLACTTRQTMQVLPADTHDRAVVVPSSVLHADARELLLSGTPTPPSDDEPLRAVFVGRLLGWKGPVYAVRAFARYAHDHPGATFDLYGEGPLRPHLEGLVDELGMEGRILLRGRVPREQLLRSLSTHHVFLFPSLHDSSGFAPIEAQTAGLPVVCLDVGGPAELVGEGCGVKVPVTTPDEAVAGLAAGLEQLSEPGAWQAASSAARAHALDPWATPTIEVLADTLYRRAGFDLGLDLPPARVTD